MEKEYLKRLGWFFEPRYWWARHLGFWLFRYSDFILAGLGIMDDMGISLARFLRVYVLPDGVLVYANLFVLIPALLLRRRVWQFVVAGLLLVLTYALLNFTLNPHPSVAEGQMSAFTAFFQLDFLDGLQLFLLSTGLRVMLEYLYSAIRFREMQAANLQTELAYLKSQVNPHFLFNTLNNIAVLSEQSPERVSPTIVRLSSVLRYQLYEGEKTRVLLAHEIENLRHYLDLEALRLNRADFDVQTSGGSPGNVAVAPLLFLPFVENALKHGVDSRGEISLRMRFDITPSALIFSLENSRPATPPAHLAGGIGLKNIRRRLQLLYPDRHELDIEDAPGAHVYRVRLKIETD